MNKKTAAIIAAVVIVALAIAGTVVAVNMNNMKNDNENSNQSQSNEKTSNTDPSKEFNPVDPSTLSYVATTSTTVAGQTVTSTIESDGKTQKTSSTVAGMTSESYITGNDVVTCVDGTCSKTTVDATSEAGNQAAADASQYRESATNAGTETIDGKEYQVWKATGSAGEVTYYIDNENRIGKISFGTTEITYEYKDVSITIPQV